MSLERMQYELMLFSRNYTKPHHTDEAVLERSAYVLLCRLENAAPMTLKEISEALGLDASTIHRQVAALLRHGHLDYARQPPGEVARRVAPTAAGRNALAQTRAILERGLRSVVGDWPEAKRQQFEGLLLDFNMQVEALEGKSWPRT